ncbi:MAG: zinc-binding alcohol dehydrogenase [Gemmatimonadetes bacterium]|nr:zinc-binding alcohol dehydrogenase [Gemmatimonadota bacterium]
MDARALICDERQQFTLADVKLRNPAPDQIAIRTHFSGVSIGTEFALIRNKLSWGPYPLCTGYMATGEVVAVGAEIDDFKTGDKVYVRGNDSIELADGTKVSCTAGTHCSHIVTKPHTTHGADHVPAGAGMDVASMFVMPAVGLNGVDMANPRFGDTVVVYGAGLIGLAVIAACAHRGCYVIAVDINKIQLEIARKMGADLCIDGSEQDVDTAVRSIVPEGADVVFESTGIPAAIDPAIALCRTSGRFVWQGNYGAAPISMQFLPPHGRRLQMFFPCDDGLQPCRRAVLKNMAMGALQWEHCITHRIDCAQAPDLYDRINKAEEQGIVGVTINWLNT